MDKVGRNQKRWLIVKDVAEVLGYKNSRKAILDHVDDEDKSEIPIQDSIGRMQKTPVINESGLYSLVLGSNLPGAKKFRGWHRDSRLHGKRTKKLL